MADIFARKSVRYYKSELEDLSSQILVTHNAKMERLKSRRLLAEWGFI